MSDSVQPATKSSPNQSTTPWRDIENKLRKRAKRAQIASQCIFGVIFVVIALGFYLIFQFGKTPEMYNLEYSDGGYSYDDYYEVQIEKLTPYEVTKKLDALDQKIVELGKKYNSVASELSSMKGYVAQEVNKLKDVPAEERRQWAELFATVTTRLGLATLLLLLIKILTAIYRYQSRLAAFYDAKADALTLAKPDDVTAYERYSSILTPSTVDFYESADTITGYAIELAKKAMPSGANQ